MAYIAKIDTNNARGAEVAAACRQIQEGLSTLRLHEGLRAATAAVSEQEFALAFGVTANAAAFRDRWNAVNAGNYTGLNEFINEILADPGV
jgi:hypothetical protein